MTVDGSFRCAVSMVLHAGGWMEMDSSVGGQLWSQLQAAVDLVPLCS